MKLFKILFIFFLLLPLTAGKAHKFYVSTTQVEYVKEEQSLQIITKVFIDDIEAVLRKRYNKPEIQLASKKETDEDARLIKQYLLKKLKIKVNGKPVTLHYLGKEYDIDILNAYLEVTNVSALETIEIENTMLTEEFPEQQNIIHLKYNKTRESLILTKDNPKGLLKFDLVSD